MPEQDEKPFNAEAFEAQCAASTAARRKALSQKPGGDTNYQVAVARFMLGCNNPKHELVLSNIEPLVAAYDEMAARCATLAQQHQEAEARATELAGQLAGVVAATREKLADVFGKLLYVGPGKDPVELQQQVRYELVQIARSLGLKDLPTGHTYRADIIEQYHKFNPNAPLLGKIEAEPLPATPPLGMISMLPEHWQYIEGAEPPKVEPWQYLIPNRPAQATGWSVYVGPKPENWPAAPPLEREAADFSTCIHECGAPAVHDGHCACYLLGSADEQDKTQPYAGGAPLEGSSPAEPWCARCSATEEEVNRPGFRCLECDTLLGRYWPEDENKAEHYNGSPASEKGGTHEAS